MTEHGNDPLIGTTVDGRYRVESRLARGGMSTVYLATDLRLHRSVALKVLYPHLAEDPSFVRRFESEAITAAKLSHQHVVSVLDQGVDGSTAYLAMEYVHGRTLRHLLHERHRLAPRQALAMMDAVVDGLAAAHAQGLVHRDMKPENVLLSDDGRIKVADFGLARAATNHTTTGTLVGTVAYISPELVTGAPADARSDIYAVGVMLYELLTGRQPFTADVPIQVAFQHVNEPVPPPSELLPGLAEDLDELVEWCTAKDPEERPHDAEALLGELRHIRATLTDEQLDFGAPGPTADAPAAGAAPGLLPAGGSATEAYGRPGAAEGATEVVDRPSDATSVISAAAHPTQALQRPSPTPDAHGRPVPVDTASIPAMGSSGSQRAAARQAKREAKAARREWDREAQRPLEQLEDRGSRRRGWILAVVLLLLAALVGTAAWFFGMGPGAPVGIPTLQGRTAEQATQQLAALGVDSTQRRIFDEKLDQGLVVGSEPAAGTQIRRFQSVELLVSKGPQLFAVPNIVGRPESAARTALEEANLEAGKASKEYNESVAEGRIVSQDPAPDQQVRRGTKVSYVLSRGPAPVAVPDLVGQGEDQARALLAAAGLKGEARGEEFSRTVPEGAVVSQKPAGGKAERGSTVTYVLSKGPRMVEVPNVRGQQIEEAEKRLRDLGFEVEIQEGTFGIIFGTVATQEPGSGSVPEGSTIVLGVV